MRDSYTAFLPGSDGMDIRPFSIAFSTCCGGKFSTISLVLIFNVRKGASRASIALSSIFSGCSCSSNHLSTPIALTRSTSPGRIPKVKRFSAWTMRLSSSIWICVTGGAASAPVGFDFDFLSPARSAAVDVNKTRPSRIRCLRATGIDAPELFYIRRILTLVITLSYVKVVEKTRLRQGHAAAGHAAVQFGNHMVDIRG